MENRFKNANPPLVKNYGGLQDSLLNPKLVIYLLLLPSLTLPASDNA